jgi:uncharacterized protein GlcG (DUF336 family)
MSDQAATRPTLSEGWAARLLAGAIEEAKTMDVRVTVVIVDESGITKTMARMDGAPLVSIETATNKAYAAAAIGMPPDDFYAAIESDVVLAAGSQLGEDRLRAQRGRGRRGGRRSGRGGGRRRSGRRCR